MFDGMGDQMTEKCREVMRSCTGKLSIQKFDGYYDKRFLSGLEEFADRIQNLTCKLNFFNAEIVPKLTLEKYEGVSYRPTMDQAEFLLRSLKVTQFSSTFWYIQRNDLTLAGLTLNERDCNYIIKHLTLTFLHCSMDVLEGFCSRLLTICPKLKSINLKAHFYSDEDPFSSDGVVEKGVALRTLYNKLKGNFVGLNYFSLEFKHEIECEKQEYDDSWIADLKRRDGFRQAKFQYEDHYRAYNKLIVEQHEDKFDGAFCVEVIYHE